VSLGSEGGLHHYVLPLKDVSCVLMAVNSRPRQKVEPIDDDSAVGIPFVRVRMTGSQVGKLAVVRLLLSLQCLRKEKEKAEM